MFSKFEPAWLCSIPLKIRFLTLSLRHFISVQMQGV